MYSICLYTACFIYTYLILNVYTLLILCVIHLMYTHTMSYTGSEMVRKSNASGQQLEEAKTINKSLSALGQVSTSYLSITLYYTPMCILHMCIMYILHIYPVHPTCIVPVHRMYTRSICVHLTS